MTTEEKQPQPGEWWFVGKNANRILVHKPTHTGRPVIESTDGWFHHHWDFKDWHHEHWYHEPRCTGWDWVDPGDGYEWVTVGVVLEDGDESESCNGGWFTTLCVGQQVREGADKKYRRKINPVEPVAIDPGDGYELVPVGALLEKGDEGFESGKWSKVYYWGHRVGNFMSQGVYRRKIKTPTEMWPKWYVFDESHGKGDSSWAIERYTTDKSWRYGFDFEGSVCRQHQAFPTIKPESWLEVTEAEAKARLTPPVEVESPDDWVAMPQSHILRKDIDQVKYLDGQWYPVMGLDGDTTKKMPIRCRRKDLPKRTDSEGRDVTGLHGLHSEGDVMTRRVSVDIISMRDNRVIWRPHGQELLNGERFIRYDADGFYVEEAE